MVVSVSTDDRTDLVCSLDPDALRERMADWHRLSAAVRERSVDGVTLTVRYAGGPGVADDVRRLVDAERDCCPFLAFDVQAEPDGGVRMIVTAPEPALLPSFG